MINQKVWYSVSQENEDELTNDVWFCGVIVKSGIVIKEDKDNFWINNFSKPISKYDYHIDRYANMIYYWICIMMAVIFIMKMKR